MNISTRITTETTALFSECPEMLAELSANAPKAKLTLRKKSLLSLKKKPVFIGI